VVEVPSTEIDQEVDKMARQYARTAKVAGFRPGKVPLDIISSAIRTRCATMSSMRSFSAAGRKPLKNMICTPWTSLWSRTSKTTRQVA